jgi:hypothetical protein
MSVSTFASDFEDDKTAEPINRSENSAISKRRAESQYNHSKYRSIFFQICQSCFWCASNLYKSRIMERCPSCKSNKIGSLPVSANNIFTYHYDG